MSTRSRKFRTYTSVRTPSAYHACAAILSTPVCFGLSVFILFGLRHEHDGLAFDDALAALVRADGVQGHDGLVLAHVFDGDARRHRVAEEDGRGKAQRLAQVDRARPRQLAREHGRDERRAEHAVRYPPAEACRHGVLFVEVYGVAVARKLRERAHVFVVYRLRDFGGVAYFESHRAFPHCERNLSTAALNSAAFSACGTWPQLSKTTNCAEGISFLNFSPSRASGVSPSSRPQMMRTGCFIPASLPSSMSSFR